MGWGLSRSAAVQGFSVDGQKRWEMKGMLGVVVHGGRVSAGRWSYLDLIVV